MKEKREIPRFIKADCDFTFISVPPNAGVSSHHESSEWLLEEYEVEFFEKTGMSMEFKGYGECEGNFGRFGSMRIESFGFDSRKKKKRRKNL